MCTQSYGGWVVQQHVCGQWSMDGCKQEITWIASNIQLTVPIDGDEKNLSKFTDETRSKMFFFPCCCVPVCCVPRTIHISCVRGALRAYCFAVLCCCCCRCARTDQKQGRLYYVTLRYGPSESAARRAHFWSVSDRHTSLSQGGEGSRQKQ